MTSICLDASVAVKWFLPRANEPLADEAIDLYREYIRGELEFFVPGFFWAEFGNILWKAVRFRRVDEASAIKAVNEMVDLSLTTIPDAELVHAAVSIAFVTQRPVYESLYIALALRYDAPMVTADERLANAVGAQLPVKWLGLV